MLEEFVFTIFFFLFLFTLSIFYRAEKMGNLLKTKKIAVASVILLLSIIFTFQVLQRNLPPMKVFNRDKPVTPVESTCSDSKVDCHWQVHYCEVYFNYPTDCQELGPANPDVSYGSVSWENYYCEYDMKCYPKGECKNGASDMINQKCSGKYGWPECPEDAFTCYWVGTNEQNVHCSIPKCCGGLCGVWDPC